MRSWLVISIVISRAAVAGTHPPMRPLPVASQRPAVTTPGYHVAPRGDDAGDGSSARPWKTIARGVRQLAPGDTLYLHAGVYFESVAVAAAGRPDAPITIRAAPGELAIVDGGLREFAETPGKAWEPVPGGAAGEFRSTATYPRPDPQADGGRGVFVLGNFADSMVPLHGYKFDADLRSANPYWNVENATPGRGIYVGPGVWLDGATGRIHIRLAPTTLRSQVNYQGETDPRKLPLVIGMARGALSIDHAKHVRIQDLVLRGSAGRTVQIADSDGVELDHVTIYGGAPALWVRSTRHLRVTSSALRGVSAPWSSRASQKYRGISPYLMIADGKLPQSQDWELAYNELTDSHDGIVIDSIKGLRFHHNRVDNFNDDALYLTLAPRQAVPEDVQIYENRISRTYTALAFAQEPGQPNTIGPGVYIYRNVFDLREGTYVWPVTDAAADARPYQLMQSRMCGDHGSPTWEPMSFYHNTVIAAADAFRDYYGQGMIMGMRGTKRRLFNNIFVQLDGDPGVNFQGATEDDLQVDGNLLWGTGGSDDFLGAFRRSPVFEASKQRSPGGFGAHDVYADPKLVDPAGGDFRLQPRSGAIDAGVAIPKAWPDSLRALDKGKPDIGAFPAGAPALVVGPR